jgi:hypothetical protein
MRATQDFQERVGRIEKLVQRLEASADPALQRAARELVGSLMEMHGVALDRIIEVLSDSGEAGKQLIRTLASDELVGNLLILYNLHPEDLETRIGRGLDKIRPVLRSQGVRLEVTAIADGAVRVKLIGVGANEFEAAVREALLEFAPDADIQIEGGRHIEGEQVERKARHDSGFVPLTSLRGVSGSPAIAGLSQP